MPTTKHQRNSPKPRFTNRGKRLTKTQLWQVQDLLTPASLPPDFERFLLTYNGGDPDPSFFDWKHPSDGKQRAHVDTLLGIDPDRLDEPSADCIRVAMRFRADLPRHALPIGFVDRDNLLLLFTEGRREGQVWVLVKDEVEHRSSRPSDPEAASYFVAKSFSKFLSTLYGLPDEHAPGTFALDSPRVRGQKLEAILKSLGCKRWKYVGIGRSNPPPPPAWEWPKYRRSGEDNWPAFLTLEKNNTEGYAPHFDERPAGHAMLCVDVIESQRAACMRELAQALGEGAVPLYAS